MGRYELVRPTLRKRIIARLFGNNFGPNLAKLELGKKFRNLVFSLLGFGFAGSYVLVTVVDPYGGTMANAYALTPTQMLKLSPMVTLHNRRSVSLGVAGRLLPVMKQQLSMSLMLQLLRQAL